MSLFPSAAYDSWKETPDEEPEPSLEDQYGYDPDAEDDGPDEDALDYADEYDREVGQ